MYERLQGNIVDLDTGEKIEDAFRILQRCGYTHFTVYQKREPEMLPI